jgi:REP element-mobilizing transposase RayT
MLAADAWRRRAESLKMDQSAYQMDYSRRQVVLAAIQERCRQQNWTLLAAHVRTNHVHLVVEAETKPERVMNDVKSYASRCLNQVGLDEEHRKRWARHGSTRWLWTREQTSTAISYVVEEQGQSMAVFEA